MTISRNLLRISYFDIDIKIDQRFKRVHVDRHNLKIRDIVFVVEKL